MLINYQYLQYTDKASRGEGGQRVRKKIRRDLKNEKTRKNSSIAHTQTHTKILEKKTEEIVIEEGKK